MSISSGCHLGKSIWRRECTTVLVWMDHCLNGPHSKEVLCVVAQDIVKKMSSVLHITWIDRCDIQLGPLGVAWRWKLANTELVQVYTRGERKVFWWPNTNTNIIRFPKDGRIWIRILFGCPKMTEYEYEYYRATQKWSNTNTNIILLPNNNRI